MKSVVVDPAGPSPRPRRCLITLLAPAGFSLSKTRFANAPALRARRAAQLRAFFTPEPPAEKLTEMAAAPAAV